jgi:hypothetical protein
MMGQLGQQSYWFKQQDRFLYRSAGTQTAALFLVVMHLITTNATEEYDGSTWTSSKEILNTARSAYAGAGTQTAALAIWW